MDYFTNYYIDISEYILIFLKYCHSKDKHFSKCSLDELKYIILFVTDLRNLKSIFHKHRIYQPTSLVFVSITYLK